LKKGVDRALKWLIDKICDARIEPIKVTLDDPGDCQNEVVDALTDPRSQTTIDSLTQSYEINKEPVYLTPHFF
jgi:hypothetical protein